MRKRYTTADVRYLLKNKGGFSESKLDESNRFNGWGSYSPGFLIRRGGKTKNEILITCCTGNINNPFDIELCLKITNTLQHYNVPYQSTLDGHIRIPRTVLSK